MKDYNQLPYVVRALLSDIANNPNNEGIFECLYNSQTFKVQYVKKYSDRRVRMHVLLNGISNLIDNLNTKCYTDFFINRNDTYLTYSTEDNTLKIADAAFNHRVTVTIPDTPKEDFLLFCKKFATTQ